jgi:ribose transport system substrate-binding protein
MRILLATLGSLAIGAAWAATTSPSSAADAEPRIALVLPGPNSYFEPWRGAVADAATKYGFTGMFGVPPTDAFNLTQENAMMDSLAGRGYTGFGVFPGDAHGTNAEEQKLAGRGVKSINVNGCTYDPSPALFCVSTDVYAAAYYQAQELIKAIGGEGDIALLTSQLTDPNTQLRIQAVKKAVEETNGKVKLVQTLADIDTPTAAPPAINALLAGQGASLAGAMATSYYPSVALATALTDNPQFRHIKGVVAENAPQVMDALEKGYLYGTLFQNTYGMAYVASYSLYKALKDRCTVREDAPFSKSPQTAKLLAAGVLLVTKDNLDKFSKGPESLPEDTDRLMKLIDDKVLKCG